MIDFYVSLILFDQSINRVIVSMFFLTITGQLRSNGTYYTPGVVSGYDAHFF